MDNSGSGELDKNALGGDDGSYWNGIDNEIRALLAPDEPDDTSASSGISKTKKNNTCGPLYVANNFAKSDSGKLLVVPVQHATSAVEFTGLPKMRGHISKEQAAFADVGNSDEDIKTAYKNNKLCALCESTGWFCILNDRVLNNCLANETMVVSKDDFLNTYKTAGQSYPENPFKSDGCVYFMNKDLVNTVVKFKNIGQFIAIKKIPFDDYTYGIKNHGTLMPSEHMIQEGLDYGFQGWRRLGEAPFEMLFGFKVLNGSENNEASKVGIHNTHWEKNVTVTCSTTGSTEHYMNIKSIYETIKGLIGHKSVVTFQNVMSDLEKYPSSGQPYKVKKKRDKKDALNIEDLNAGDKGLPELTPFLEAFASFIHKRLIARETVREREGLRFYVVDTSGGENMNMSVSPSVDVPRKQLSNFLVKLEEGSIVKFLTRKNVCNLLTKKEFAVLPEVSCKSTSKIVVYELFEICDSSEDTIRMIRMDSQDLNILKLSLIAAVKGGDKLLLNLIPKWAEFRKKIGEEELKSEGAADGTIQALNQEVETEMEMPTTEQAEAEQEHGGFEDAVDDVSSNEDSGVARSQERSNKLVKRAGPLPKGIRNICQTCAVSAVSTIFVHVN